MTGQPKRRRVPREVVAAPEAGPDEPPLGPGDVEEGAWRELWYGSLEALRREPVLNTTQEAVLAQLGAVAFLHCPVRHLGERGVSWVRRRDWHIISSGVLLYTNDERFQVLHSEGSDDWILQIKYVQKRDNGTYECQYVFWYHNARMINYDAARGVSVVTSPGPRTQSALAIHSAAPHHSGNYSCRAPNTEPAHIFVYVSEGSDKMAATLSRNGADECSALSRALLTLALMSAPRGVLERGRAW
ncbi:Immunoglobulin domain-containing protein-3 [Operophtera brumata]|uniref:Immunoglobulin domain-containing protein-3 n=1 Tax=Operophtera brumata TaxID=104452 RepID=A0A0L7L0V0_OPEBR|nr:Immunoglobulin domain-containing protein-3 [Operophtera brumata]